MDEIKWGDPRLPLRFWTKTEVHVTTGCWMWTAGTDDEGYAYFRFPKPLTTRRAARGAYITLVGPVDDDMTIQHDCHRHGCVNVNIGHACRLLTSPDNVREGKAHIKACPAGHRYTEKNIIWVGAEDEPKRRGCRICYNDHSREYWHTTRKHAQKRERRAAGYRGGWDETPECVNGHPKTAKNTYVSPTGAKACNICRREAAARYNTKKAGRL